MTRAAEYFTLDHVDGFSVVLQDAGTLRYRSGDVDVVLGADLSTVPVTVSAEPSANAPRAVSRAVAALLSVGLPVDVNAGDVEPEELVRLVLAGTETPTLAVLSLLDALADGQGARLTLDDVGVDLAVDGSATVVLADVTEDGTLLALHLSRDAAALTLLSAAITTTSRAVVHWALDEDGLVFAAGEADLDFAGIGDGVANVHVRWDDEVPSISLLVGAVGAGIVVRTRTAVLLGVTDHGDVVPALLRAVRGAGVFAEQPSAVEIVTAAGTTTAPGGLDAMGVAEWVAAEFERLSVAHGDDSTGRDVDAGEPGDTGLN